MLNFYLIWSSCYLILLWVLGRTWKVSPLQVSSLNKDLKISLLIPIRNELENLPSLKSELEKQKKSVYEIILIDDHSEDGSFEFLIESFLGFEKTKILKNQGSGKKSAISTGVSVAMGEIICCTDADCRFSKNWIESICSPFRNESIQLVAGPVMSFGSGSFFSNFQQIEWSSILIVTNYFFSKSTPLMCSAANMAYRKSAFENVEGYAGNLDQASGDDEFLLKKIISKFPKASCVYVNHVEALVLTNSQKNWTSLVQQRIRWASKWRAHQSILHSFSTLVSFFIQLVWLGSYLLLFQGVYGILGFLSVWTLKIVVEGYVLSCPLKTYFISLKPINFIFTSLIHPFFVILIGLATWKGKFTWKGRSNERSVILANKS